MNSLSKFVLRVLFGNLVLSKYTFSAELLFDKKVLVAQISMHYIKVKEAVLISSYLNIYVAI